MMNSKIHKSQRKFAAGLAAFLTESPLRLTSQPGAAEPATSLAAWFLGPKAENEPLLYELVRQAIEMHARDRREYFRDDPAYVTEEIINSPAYIGSVNLLKARFTDLLEDLRGSVPFWSYRWQSHMNWDTALPAMAAYFAAMLYNPNNVAAEASPVTTPLEIHVGNDLCTLLGYPSPGEQGTDGITPWGHLTCDGSVANLEGMWAARNLKYYPLSLALALKNEAVLAPARNILIALPGGGQEPLAELDRWKLLNLRADDILAIPARLANEFGIGVETLSAALEEYNLQNVGIDGLRLLAGEQGPMPVVLAPSTMHYSWPKNAAILGLGKRNVLAVRVDLDARMDLTHLRSRLEDCLANRCPVIMAVAVLGSTEESAVDPLLGLLAMRDEYRRRGLEFPVHVDAAWGGYFASMLRRPPGAPQVRRVSTPALGMSAYVNAQYEVLGQADSITIDPHKAGFIPYPAGGLCYRHSAMRNLVSFAAPVVYHGGIDPTVGIYGVEGSKPGAAAAAVFLSHRIIPLDQTGYGTILGKSLFNSKRFYAALVTMAGDEEPFTVTCLQRLPAEREGRDAGVVRAQIDFIRERIVPCDNDSLMADDEAAALFRELGSDQVILSYVFNLKVDGVVNRDVRRANALNSEIFRRLSLSPDRDRVSETPLIVTSSTFQPDVYGVEFVDAFKRRAGLDEGTAEGVDFLISTTMNPWLTDTAEGNFIPTLIRALRGTVRQIISTM